MQQRSCAAMSIRQLSRQEKWQKITPAWAPGGPCVVGLERQEARLGRQEARPEAVWRVRRPKTLVLPSACLFLARAVGAVGRTQAPKLQTRQAPQRNVCIEIGF